MLKLPSYNKKSEISMSDVMSATYKDFLDLGVDQNVFLRALQKRLEDHPDSLEVSNFLHQKLDEYESEGCKNRTPGYQLQKEYCAIYNLYCFLLRDFGFKCGDGEEVLYKFYVDLIKDLIEDNYNHKSEKKVSRGDVAIIKCGSVVRSTNPRKGEFTTKRKQTVKVHDCHLKYYYRGIVPSSIVWAGAGGYWCETEVSNLI